MKYPQRIGDKFTSKTVAGGDRVLTCSGFHGSDGKLYTTLADCQAANPNDPFVCVENVAFGGSTELEKTKLFEQ